MTCHNFLLLLSLSIIGVIAQYNTPPPYDRNYTDNYQDRPYDRQNQYDRNQPPYDRQNPPYGQYDRNNPPYDRNNPPPYDRNNPPYDRNNPPSYDRNNPPPPYDRNNPPPYDRYNPYDRNQYNQSQYGRQNQSYYGPQGPPYDNRDRYYTGNRDQYGSNRDQYSGNRDQYGGNRDPYNNRDHYNRDRYDNRDQYGDNRDQYGGNRDQFNRNRDPYSSGNDFGQQYGTPLADNGDCCQEYCYRNDPAPYLMFATKTAYQLVSGKETSSQHRIPDCTPIQFWSINRHGTRYPSFRTIQRLRQMTKLHAEIVRNYEEKRSYPDRGRLCPEDLELFKRWHWNESINERNANALTEQGIMDMKFIARRYVSKFSELMREPYSEETYRFQYTDSDRTHDSYQAFIEGLFKDKAFQVHANVYNNDRLIRPTKSCNTWNREVDQNPQISNEYMRFKRKQEYQQMVRDVFRRLGFRYTLNDSVLNDMYDLCRYEKAWNLDQPSPWCIVFNKEQLKLLEYAEDLKYYYKTGYGNEISRQIGCPPLKDLYETFDRTVNNNGNIVRNKVTVFFTHSSAIQTLLTAMGIAKDYSPLTADNYYQQKNRQWRTSKIDPFASNLAAVLYQCRSAEKFRVMFFLNEEPVNFPECSVGLCNWSTVQNKFRYAAENCNLDFCDRSKAAGLRFTFVTYFITFIAIFTSFRIFNV